MTFKINKALRKPLKRDAQWGGIYCEHPDSVPVKTLDITAIEFAMWMLIAVVVGVSMGRVSHSMWPNVQPAAQVQASE